MIRSSLKRTFFLNKTEIAFGCDDDAYMMSMNNIKQRKKINKKRKYTNGCPKPMLVRMCNRMNSMLFQMCARQVLKISSSILFFISRTILLKYGNSFYFFIGSDHGMARDS